MALVNESESTVMNYTNAQDTADIVNRLCMILTSMSTDDMYTSRDVYNDIQDLLKDSVKCLNDLYMNPRAYERRLMVEFGVRSGSGAS